MEEMEAMSVRWSRIVLNRIDDGFSESYSLSVEIEGYEYVSYMDDRDDLLKALNKLMEN